MFRECDYYKFYIRELLSFEKGLFVSSGLMGNQISLLIHNEPGTEVITPHDSHIKNYEHGAAAFLSRVQFRDAQNIDGEVDLEFIEKLILKSKIHKPQIKTISIENTHLLIVSALAINGAK